MKSLFSISPPQYIGIIFALVFILAPFSTLASSGTPTCSLTVTTLEGAVKVQSNETEKVLLYAGDEIRIVWKSSGAKKSFDIEGNTILSSGFATSSPSTTTTYAYRFSNGTKKVTCTVEVTVVTGSITTSEVITASTRATIVGKANGVKTVQIKVYKEGSSKAVFTSNVMRVKDGAWKTRISKKLLNGNYIVMLFGEKKLALNMIASSTLSVGAIAKKETKGTTTLVVESVPLLTGGFAHAGASVAVSYVQVINIGNESTPVKGFWLAQNGTAISESIVGFTVTDDVGISHGSVNDVVFKNGLTLVSTNAVLAPGQMRLFTIKAILTQNVGQHLGKQLKIDIASVESPATVKSKFPIRGTTWTIVQ